MVLSHSHIDSKKWHKITNGSRMKVKSRIMGIFNGQTPLMPVYCK